ncbi:MAG TPA: hypothetical protein VF509_04795 [Sphingobium sp.]
MARARFLGSLDIAKSRLSASRLKARAQALVVEALQDSGKQARSAVVRHPFALGAFLTAVIAFIFRRPLTALFKRLYVLGRDKYQSIRHSED